MYQVLFKIAGQWFHLDGLFKTLDKAIEKGYGLTIGFYSVRFIDEVEIVKMVLEGDSIVSRELVKSYTVNQEGRRP